MSARRFTPEFSKGRNVLIVALALATIASAAAPAAANASPAASWQIRTLTQPTYISPTEGGKLFVFASDVGALATSGEVTVTDTLPSGLTPTSVAPERTGAGGEPTCGIVGQTVTCTYSDPLRPLNQEQLVIPIIVSPTHQTPGKFVNTAAVSGGGAVEATATETVSVTAQVPPFGIADFSTLDANAAGGQDTQAGDHPSALVTTFDINTVVSPDPSAQKKIEGVEDLKPHQSARPTT